MRANGETPVPVQLTNQYAYSCYNLSVGLAFLSLDSMCKRPRRWLIKQIKVIFLRDNRSDNIQGMSCISGNKRWSSQVRVGPRLRAKIDKDGVTARPLARLYVMKDISHKPRVLQVDIQFRCRSQ